MEDCSFTTPLLNTALPRNQPSPHNLRKLKVNLLSSFFSDCVHFKDRE
uniref:Uncharacterized protein n=1 Tax=Anguilla anguilla TaxID=7936 RepID=A0A0E9PNJ9_ANGAN